MTNGFIRRNQTIVSFSQLEEDSEKAQAFGPTSHLSACPGHALPLYAFGVAPPPKRKYRRVNSFKAVAIVPDDDYEDEEMLGGNSEDDQDTEVSTPNSRDQIGLVPSMMAYSPNSCGSPESEEVPTIAMTDSSADGEAVAFSSAPAGNLLDTVITALWDDCAARGLFRYDISTVSTKLVDGPTGYVAQLNEGRFTKKRPTEVRVDQVCQPFDEGKFNFKKAFAREVLFQFEPLPPLPRGAPCPGPQMLDASPCCDSPNLVVINVSPIEYGHVLLVPRVLDNLPQLVCPETVELALHFAKEADNPNFRVGYNSLGAYATINHLHFQAYYLDADFPVENCAVGPVEGVHGTRRVRVGRLLDYPVNAFVIELVAGVTAEQGLSELARVVGTACLKLQEINVPHNLLITDCGRKIFLYPQLFSERQAAGQIPEEVLECGVNPAAFEISGHILLKRAEDYESITEDMVNRLLGYASVPEQQFNQLALLCFGSLGRASCGSRKTSLEVQRAVSLKEQAA